MDWAFQLSLTVTLEISRVFTVSLLCIIICNGETNLLFGNENKLIQMELELMGTPCREFNLVFFTSETAQGCVGVLFVLRVDENKAK